MTSASDLPAAVEDVTRIIRDVTAEEILPRYRRLKDHEISDKKSGEIVTAADIESERRLAEAFTALVPGSRIVGEESYDRDPEIVRHFAGDAPVWIIDPLDGTRNFAEGKDCFCVIVACCVSRETLMGWIYNPLNDDMITATLGGGVSDKAGPIALNAPRAIPEMRGSVGKRRRDRFIDKNGRVRPGYPKEMIRYRCIGREYVDLVRGRLDFAEYGNLKPWDHAAGALFLEEAGGHGAYTDTGKKYVPGPIVAKRFVAAPDAGNWRRLIELLDG